MSDINVNEVSLTPGELDDLLSPAAIRRQARRIFELTAEGRTSFIYDPAKLRRTTDYVLQVIKKNYPSLDIPFHSRWGHFRAGGIDRAKKIDQLLVPVDATERARAKLDLVITSVLLDAGAGSKWRFFEEETKAQYGRSEGLGVASLAMFVAGAMSSDGKSLRADAEGLRKVTPELLGAYFQVSDSNPLVGLEGRAALLNGLAGATENKSMFRDGRPGNILDYLIGRYGRTVTAPQILRAVLDGFGPIWPGRLTSGGINLGDVWRYEPLRGAGDEHGLVPFHKLSQWMTYSLIEPILEAGIEVVGVEDMTGLAEYRNGGLMLDSGLIRLKNASDAAVPLEPGSSIIVEWRALTVHLLDEIGKGVQQALQKTPAQFPLAKVLEGGTWWAGRYLAQEKRSGGTPPLDIKSDGTVF